MAKKMGTFEATFRAMSIFGLNHQYLIIFSLCLNDSIILVSCVVAAIIFYVTEEIIVQINIIFHCL